VGANPHNPPYLKYECGRRDSNSHTLRRHPLKMVRLPVPPRPQTDCLFEWASLDSNQGPLPYQRSALTN
jgi:hypothetical protein